MTPLSPECRPLLIGSFPCTEHHHALDLIFAHTPEIPIWPQLPVYPDEGMMAQFLSGFPGVVTRDGKTWIDTSSSEFDEQLLGFFEEYVVLLEDSAGLDQSRFVFSAEAGKGFTGLLDYSQRHQEKLFALKGQVTGPVTFCTGVVDEAGRAIFYNDQLRDAAIKMLALKAKWQLRKMQAICPNVLVFFDEPGLAGFGSSAFITITKEDVQAALNEVFAAVQEEGGFTGVHVCANTEWPVLFDTTVDILSYDAYSYFDKLVLYQDGLKQFIRRGGMLATGIIPTAAEFIAGSNAQTLADQWFSQTEQLTGIGLTKEEIYRQTFITPSCGTGALSESNAVKVLELTRDVSALIRQHFS